MSILSFFAHQRRRWFDRLTDYPADYFAGAWAALLQAETAFLKTPLANGHLEAHRVRQELEAAQNDLHETRKKLEQAREQLRKADPFILAAKRGEKDANRAAQQVRRQVALIRKALQRMQGVAGNDEFEPEVRLRYLENMLQSHLALLRDENLGERPPVQ
jgi:hypothetical protein